MPYDFVIADIFTDQAFGGNQLAVITDARGLSGEQMQSLAREFNFSESTFVLPSTREGADFTLRIFTPQAELKFAGHPTVGTAAVLASACIHKPGGDSSEIVFDEGVGLVSVEVRAKDGALWSRLTLIADVEMPGGEPGRDILAEVLSLPEGAVLDRWFGGIANSFCFVWLVSEEMVDRAVLDRAAWSRHLESGWGPQLFFFAGDPDQGRLYARMFGPGLGIDEDAATGSASAVLAGCVAMRRSEPELDIALSITQGVKMGRPSRLEASAVKVGGRVRSVSVGGNSVVVASGQLHVPRF